MLATLSTDEILSIYDTLLVDFAATGDPMSPPGVKSMDMLESAVSRQHTGFGGKLKYEFAVSNASTLCYGICCNHPFHNGNKRTALVALLCHLDRNDRTFDEGVSQDELYEVMLRVASHTLARPGASSDEEVEALAKWVRKRIRTIESGERIVTCRELRTLLQNYGFELENHDSNHIDVVRTVSSGGFLGLRKSLRKEKLTRIPYARDGAQVGRSTLKEVREKCGLTAADGVDSGMFYAQRRLPDYFVARYSKTLKRLART